MKLIKPKYEILSKLEGIEVLRNIERAGRTCYKSENKITDESAKNFIKMLIERGHESVLEHEKITVLFICDRGVSHEIVRHRIASFSQESTRYCNYGKGDVTFIIPNWLQKFEFTDNVPHPYLVWYDSMQDSEIAYKQLLNDGWTPQQARSVLPNSLKTEIVVTANIREWRTIFKQRTSPAAHPQMRELMCPLLEELKTIIPIVFDDLEKHE